MRVKSEKLCACVSAAITTSLMWEECKVRLHYFQSEELLSLPLSLDSELPLLTLMFNLYWSEQLVRLALKDVVQNDRLYGINPNLIGCIRLTGELLPNPAFDRRVPNFIS